MKRYLKILKFNKQKKNIYNKIIKISFFEIIEYKNNLY